MTQPALIEQTYPIPPWLPAPLQDRLAPALRLRPAAGGQAAAAAPGEDQPCPNGPERHRHVTAIDAAPGPWDASLVPTPARSWDSIGKPWCGR